MFGLSAASLIGYGLVAAIGAGGIGWVWHVVDERDDLLVENADLSAALRKSKTSIERAADVGAQVLKEADAKRAQAERENRQAAGQIQRLEDLLKNPKPSTCEAAVRSVQALMP